MPDRDLSHMVGDARKRLADSFIEGQVDYSVTRDALQADIDELRAKARIPSAILPNHDEVHAHEDVDLNIVRGED